MFGNLLVPIVMKKIPSELRLVVSRKFGSEESWNLDALLSALKTELEARERCTAMKTSGPNVNSPRFEQYRARSKQPYSASALYTGSENFTRYHSGFPLNYIYLGLVVEKLKKTRSREGTRRFYEIVQTSRGVVD